MATEEPSRARKTAAGITGALLAGVMVVGSFVGSAVDANSLTKPVNDALGAAGLQGTTAKMTGREAKLTGPASDKDAAQAAAQDVYGVRWATYEDSGAAPAVEAELPTIDISHNDSGTTLNGSVPSEDIKAQLETEAGRIFGQPVTNNLTVDPKLASPDWLSGLTGALPKLPAIGLGALSLNGPDGLKLTGEVPDLPSIDGIKADLSAALPGITSDVNLTMPTASPAELPTIDISNTGSGTTLNGSVPSEDIKAQLETEAGRIFGQPVTNNLTVDPKLASPDWLSGLTGALPKLPAIGLGALSLNGPDGLKLTGEVPDLPTSDGIKADLEGALPGITSSIDLTVPTPTPSETPVQVSPEVTIDASSGSGVTVSGTVPDQATADKIVTAAAKSFGKPVTNNLTIDPASDGSAWLPGLLGALPKLPTITNGKLTASDDGVTLTGEVDKPATADSAKSLVEGAVSIPADVKLTAPTPEPKPTPTETGVPADVIKSINGTTVWYPTSSFALTSADKKKLNAAIANMKKYKSIKVEVEGYVSLPHNEKTQMSFSKARAQSVKDYLVKGGIDANRITVAGKGASNPIASNDNAAGRLKNQRATLTVKES